MIRHAVASSGAVFVFATILYVAFKVSFPQRLVSEGIGPTPKSLDESLVENGNWQSEPVSTIAIGQRLRGGLHRSKLEIFERSLASWSSPQKQRAFDALEAKYPNAFDRFVVTAKAAAHSSALEQTTMLYDMCAAHSPYYVNTDYDGSDLIKGGITNIASVQDCCAKCVATSGCKYFTYGTDKKTCWVKSGSTGKEAQSYRTSGDVCMWTYPPTNAPTALPTISPSLSPTSTPSRTLTDTPSDGPSSAPVVKPSVAEPSIESSPTAPTASPTAQPMALPTDVPSASAATSEPEADVARIQYGEVINIVNQYSLMYLDTRGAGCEGNALCVSASSSRNRDGGSGWWKIVSNSNKVGTVMYGDMVHLLNEYSPVYLDTRGAGCEGNELCVSGAKSSSRDGGSGTWRVIPVDQPPLTISPTETISSQKSAAPESPVVYITQEDLRVALQLLSRNLIAYIDRKCAAVDEDEPDKLLALKQELKVYISEQLNLLVSTSSSGSLAQLKKELFDAVNAKIDTVVHQIDTNSTEPSTWEVPDANVKQQISVRPLPHEHDLYKDKEKLEGDRPSAEYMIKGMDGVLGTDSQGDDPLGHSAQAMIPYKITKTKHVTADGKLLECDPLAGWGFNYC